MDKGEYLRRSAPDLGALPQRKPLRLRGYDYASDGVYFVTICTAQGAPPLSTITDGGVQYSVVGAIVAGSWQDLPSRFAAAELDAYVIMPDHVHGVIALRHRAGSQDRPSLSSVMRAFKSLSAVSANRVCQTPGRRFWQPKFYDHIVSDETDLERIREYIEANPARWEEGKHEPHLPPT